MQGNIEYLKDKWQMNYLGIAIDQDIVQPFLEQLEVVLSDRFSKFSEQQKKRDLGTYHITVINSTEYTNLMDSFGIDKFINSLDHLFDKKLQFTLIGLGKAQKENNSEYFIIVKSDHLNEVRRMYGLAPKDFCITLGFYPHEVHGVRKNILVPLKDPFLKLLSDNYYNHNQSFEFLRDLEFFDADPDGEIEAIKIEDTLATFRVEQNYFSVSLINNDLKISAKWQESKNKPKLSDTIISRKLKNI